LWYLGRQPLPEEGEPLVTTPETRQEMRTLLKQSRNVRLKGKAIIEERIREIGPAGVPVLVESLEDKDPKIRMFAAQMLRYSDDISVAPYLETLLDDGHASVRAAAAETLGRLGAVEPVPALIAALEDKNEDVRCQAARALGHLRDERAVLPLSGMLYKDVSPPARQAAAFALGEIGNMRALTILKAAVDDPDPNVRATASSAVKRVKKVDTPSDEMDDLKEWLDDVVQDLDSKM
jgi:HEAT repeat protein